MNDSAVKLLREFDLRVTTPRVLILGVLMSNPSKAFSIQQFLKVLGKEMDRSTIYRTLDKLLLQNVINKMTSPDGETIYSLQGAKTCDHHTHPHLKCSVCGAVECLPSYPHGYLNELAASGVSEVNVVLNGICKSCSGE